MEKSTIAEMSGYRHLAQVLVRLIAFLFVGITTTMVVAVYAQFGPGEKYPRLEHPVVLTGVVVDVSTREQRSRNPQPTVKGLVKLAVEKKFMGTVADTVEFWTNSLIYHSPGSNEVSFTREYGNPWYLSGDRLVVIGYCPLGLEGIWLDSTAAVAGSSYQQFRLVWSLFVEGDGPIRLTDRVVDRPWAGLRPEVASPSLEPRPASGKEYVVLHDRIVRTTERVDSLDTVEQAVADIVAYYQRNHRN